ncbi:MAG TPA: aldo/keto reductase [Actinomycetes bacterium]|jgi:aryl-alcohol dehydrogenase-like predicted oxidoreductase|nr:aldo/keto reductase [Actinomycetes bacterium]
MSALPARPLGSSGLSVSVLSLGSWRTYERIPRSAGLAVMSTARESGISFLDDARYDDETGSAPVPTGYSEMVFGELFRAAGWRRDEVVIANKLWWEFWPGQDAAEELDGSLQRMRLDHIDLGYSAPPPEGLGLEDLVGQVAGLVTAGKLRAWGVLNWPAAMVAEAVRIAEANGWPRPCAAQLAYNLVHRSEVEDPPVAEVLEANGLRVVASSVLAAGALTGKYGAAGAEGRLAGNLGSPRHGPALRVAEELRDMARDLGTTPAALAIAFALASPLVCSVLFGATRPAQVTANLEAVEVLRRLDRERLATLRALGGTGP